ncbi:hypothetical protein JXM67_05400 [candidate division WOR-3 bacterium]|nr:hypothetical protein [candidate division WOR-3 bacterium]
MFHDKQQYPEELNLEKCPRCGSPLSKGYLGIRPLIRWYTEEITFHHMKSSTWGQPLLGHSKGRPTKTSELIIAMQCNSCGLVLFTSNPPQHGDDEGKEWLKAWRNNHFLNIILWITILLMWIWRLIDLIIH